MIFPARRLLWLTGLILLPTGVLPLLLPRGAEISEIIAAVFLAIVFLDALLSERGQGGYSVETDSEIRATLHEEQAFSVRLKIADRKRLPRSLRVAVLLPKETEPVLDETTIRPESSSCSIEMRLKGAARGEFSLSEAYLGVASALGLWELRRMVPLATRILVYPALKRDVRLAAKLLAAHTHNDQRLAPRNGRGREFDHLREFTPGDEISLVDWKATARRRSPITRQYKVERTQDIYVCIDASRYSSQSVRTESGQSLELLDEYISSAIMLRYMICRTGDRFGLMTFSNRVHHFMPASNGCGSDRPLRTALYALKPQPATPAFDEASAVLQTKVRKRSLFVFLTHLGQPQLADEFLKAVRPLARRHIVVAACPTDARTKAIFQDARQQDANAPGVEAIYGQLAGHLFWKRLREIRSRLAEANVRMDFVAPRNLGVFAASAYLDVKERQLL